MAVAPFRQRQIGLAPTALALARRANAVRRARRRQRRGDVRRERSARAIRRSHSHGVVSDEPRRQRRRKAARHRRAARRRLGRRHDERKARTLRARESRCGECAARSDGRRARRVHDGGGVEQSPHARVIRRSTCCREEQRAARRAAAARRSVADQPRRLHHPGEPHLRPGARRSRSRRARQLARHLRPRRHAERACAVGAVRDARPLLRLGRQLGRWTSVAHAGERDRLSDVAALLRAQLSVGRRRRAGVFVGRFSLGECAGEEEDGDHLRRVRASAAEIVPRHPLADARAISAAAERLRVPQGAAANALRHAFGHSVARPRARARVSGLDAGSARRREGRRHPVASRQLGIVGADAEPRHDHPAERSHRRNVGRLVHAKGVRRRQRPRARQDRRRA